MGTKVAPAYATLTIGFLEKKLYENVNEFKNPWKRFLDHYFNPWTKSETDLETLHKILNSLDDYIKFTLDSSENKLPFLD